MDSEPKKKAGGTFRLRPLIASFFLYFIIQQSAFSIARVYQVTLAPKRMTRGAMMLLMLFGGSVVEEDPTAVVAL